MKFVDLTNPIALATIIANSNANSIAVNATGTSYASQEEGFPHITMIPEDNGGEAPHGLDFNGFLKMLSSHVFNIQNGLPETFNPAVSSLIGGYPKNAQLWLIDDNNSRLLKSTKDDNTDNFLTTPSYIGTSWIDAFPTQDYVDNTFVTKATAQTITGAKTFSQTGTDASIVQSTTLTTDGAYVDLIQNINNNRRGTLRTMYDADDDSYTVTLGCNGPNASSPSGINIKRTASEVTATAPKPTENNTTSTQIDTVGERNTKINSVLSALYPVGSLYITTNNAATCPLASLISGSTWALVEAGRALWTANKDGNKKIAAGLPNITGRYSHRCLMNDTNGTEVGAFRTLNNSSDTATQYAAGSDSGNKRTISFDASRSSSIYGSSTTVQPPAYTVNVWRRTA